MYMVLSLVLLGILSIGLAYLWHQRITGYNALLSTIKSKPQGNKIDVSQERAYGHCISHQWVLDYIRKEKESKIGNSIRDFVNNRTVLGIFTLGVLICPITALLVVLFYRSFAFLGASIAVFIIAGFLIRTSSDVRVSYRLLAWLRTQNNSELDENDIVYTETSIKTLTKWRMILVTVALLSLIAAPWGELIPEAVALGTSSFLIMVFMLIYPPIATYSHEVGILVTLYSIPIALALFYILFRSFSRLSVLVTEKLQEVRPV